MKASKIFLSIRQGELTLNGFTIKSRQRKPDAKNNLYYKVIDPADTETEVKNLHRMVAEDTEPFLRFVNYEIKDKESKNVLFFIHGYHPFKNILHLSLLNELANTYAPDNGNASFGTIIFFSWPNRGLQWTADDKTAKIGQTLATAYSSMFVGLSNLCKANGGKFYLMSQSFGHHVLNAFLANFRSAIPCFEKAFLMAADIPNHALNIAPEVGIRVKNTLGKGPDYHYFNLTPIKFHSTETHVFYDVCDVILSASKVNFLNNCERLGKTGPQGGSIDASVIVHNYDIYKDGMYLGPEIKVNNLFFKLIGKRQEKYNHRHQYFYTNPKVVEIIKGLI